MVPNKTKPKGLVVPNTAGVFNDESATPTDNNPSCSGHSVECDSSDVEMRQHLLNMINSPDCDLESVGLKADEYLRRVMFINNDGDYESKVEIGKCRGKLQPIAAKILMKILYAARLCRFDLLRSVCSLACDVTRWTETSDKRLHRLMCYIKTTKHYRMYGYIGDAQSDLSLELFCRC